MFEQYREKLEKEMSVFYSSLSEKDRRRYAAIEANKLGYGGLAYIAALFCCDEKTIQKGMADLLNDESMIQDTVRRPGGGRKASLEIYQDIDKIFLDVLRNHTAGDPMDEKVKWTNLTRSEIREKMQKKGIKLSKNIIKKLLKKNGFVKRKALKKTSTGNHENRDQQFININNKRAEYMNSINPIISIDAKKKEFIGNLYRDGSLETTEPILVYDHDFPQLADGKVNIYSIFDLKNNESFVNIGTSHDTSDYVCDSIKIWWNTIGKNRFPNATSILILADGGGSNSSRHHLFKESLQNLANKLGLELRMAHYPPYTSKWNPIEHRVFPHITRSLSGVVLSSISLIKELIKKTTTKTGLKVFTRVSKKIYETGKKVASDFYEYANIKFDSVLVNWNYVVNPNV
jgi:hypothetical protein